MNQLEINAAVIQFKCQSQNQNMPFLVGAALAGNLTVFKELLLSPSINVNAAGPGGVTALMAVIGLARSDRRFFDAIIKHTDIDLAQADDRGNTPLHYAAVFGQCYCANVLLRQNKSLAVQKNGYGLTPMDNFCRSVASLRRHALRTGNRTRYNFYAEISAQMKCVFDKRKINALDFNM